MLFTYNALDTDGNRTSGEIDAQDKQAAQNALQRRGLVVTSIEQADGGGASGFLTQDITLFERVSQKDLVILSRQLSTLFNAKVSALRVFQLLAAEADNKKLQRTLQDIAEELQGGTTISEAMKRHPDVFSDFYVSMVKAGEESGRLDETFTYLAEYLERMYQITSKARNALIYPIFVVIVFIAVMALIFTVVIPKIRPILEESGQGLPFYTEIVLAISGFFAQYWLLVVAVVIAIGVLFWKYARTSQGKRVIDTAILQVPYVGDLAQKLFLARMAGNLQTMLASGIPMVRALEITRDVLNNEVYTEIIENAIEEVRGGSSLSSALADYPEMPGIMVQMIKVGEETGELGSLLSTLSDFYEREVRTSVDTLIGLIEPMLIVVLGLSVGFLLMSVLMPIYNLASGF